MNRFLDENNIKKKQLHDTAEKLKAIKQNKITALSEKVDEIPKEISKETPLQEQLENELLKQENIEEPIKPKKTRKRKKNKEIEVYQQEIEKIIADNPQLEPNPQGVQVNIQTDFTPVYNVYRENKKVKVETETFQQQKEVNNMAVNNKEILLNKQITTNNELLNEQIELEICSRMKLQVEEKLQPIYDGKLKKIQSHIKELELRSSIIANLIAGR